MNEFNYFKVRVYAKKILDYYGDTYVTNQIQKHAQDFKTDESVSQHLNANNTFKSYCTDKLIKKFLRWASVDVSVSTKDGRYELHCTLVSVAYRCVYITTDKTYVLCDVDKVLFHLKHDSRYVIKLVE